MSKKVYGLFTALLVTVIAISLGILLFSQISVEHVEAAAGAACGSHSDCSKGYLCGGGNCTIWDCFSDGDCSMFGSGLYCEFNLNPPRPGGGGLCTSTSHKGGSAPATPAPTPAPTPTPVPKASIASKSVPQNFKKQGSKTTDFSSLNQEQAKSVSDVTIDDPTTTMIKFTKALDLSSDEVANKFQELNKYVTLGKGYVEIKSAQFPQLNVQAQVTMRNMNLIQNQFKILKDGKDVTETIEGLKYTAQNKQLLFNVKGFSKYVVVGNLLLDQSDEEVEKNIYTVSGQVGDVGSKVVIKLNGTELESEIKPNKEGKFTTEAALEEGDNEIVVEATSTSGFKETRNLNIKYTKPVVEVIQENLPVILLVAVVIIIVIVVIVVIVIKFLKRKKGKKKDIVKKDSVKMDKNETEDLASAKDQIDNLEPTKS